MRPDKDRYTLFLVNYRETADKKRWECVDLKPVTWSLTHDQAKAVAENMYRSEVNMDQDGTIWNSYTLPGVVLDGCSLPKHHLMVPHCFRQWQRNYYELIGA